MELIYNLQGVSGALPGAVVSVGNFDGLHIGHAKIVKDIVRRARAAKVASAIVTFHPHSLAIVAPGRAPPLLLAFDEKLRLLERMGLDAVVCPQQGKSVLGLSPEKFVKDILLGVIGASCIIEGRGFRFGKGRVGTLRTLRALGRRHGFDVQIIEAVKVGGRIVSSTRIRRLIRGGRMREAARCMGRPFTYVGSVMRGHDRGARMGFPTVNLKSPRFLVPAIGVYAGWAVVRGKRYRAAICVGGAETFGNRDPQMVEAHLLGFDAAVYGEAVSVEFHRRLRDQKMFRDEHALQKQMEKDRQRVARLPEK